MRKQKPRVYVGTSGWSYADWQGRFYPEGVKARDWLNYYAQKFCTVEVNATFYRIPTPAMIASWNARLPEEFHLVLKGARSVTHLARLENFATDLEIFLERIQPLKRLQVILWQLPPSFHLDLDRVERFLAVLPRDYRYAMEFRHPSWWCKDTAQLLQHHKAAFVAVSHLRLPAEIIPTTDFLYLRFHGLGRQLYRYDYSEAELREWAARVSAFLKTCAVYAFFNNDWEANAPKNAKQFEQLLLKGTTEV